ncbi:MAG: cytochrome c biogenesis protein CcsA [Bacteroides sp.]|nr:MAG: cytochrome c biogenesis protein CcsA [Bacteroides sp.]
MINKFVGEHLIPGIIGDNCIFLSFILTFLSFISYTYYNRYVSRILYIINCLLTYIAILCLGYIMYNNYFEYYYVWAHTSKYAPYYYNIASIWEGQEGSFILWIFWESVLGLIIMYFYPKWEKKMMLLILISSLMLKSMILGINFWGVKIGSSPFTLLRDIKFTNNNPGLDYLSNIFDGQGLNILLKNYWMIIHPPTLFAGYAVMIMPYIFSLISLTTKNYKSSIKHAIIWSLISALVLGSGIIMGALWAYESLNFGGYWSWDPVENLSLIPWLVNIANLHILIILYKKQKAHLLTIIFSFISFLSVLYSSFMTKSGILENTSIHSFTNTGLSTQLIIYIIIILLGFLFILFKNKNNLLRNNNEDDLLSKDFWMLIGSLIIFVSSIQIFIATSIPIWNKVFNTNIAPPVDPIKSFNNIQMPIVCIALFVCSISQILDYNYKNIYKILNCTKNYYIIVCTIIVNIIFFYFNNQNLSFIHILLIFISLLNIITNSFFLFKTFLKTTKYNISINGSSIAHIGFGIMIIGIIISGTQKSIISRNNFQIDYNKNLTYKENVLLIKNIPVYSKEHCILYQYDYINNDKNYYKINIKTLYDNAVIEELNLYPSIIVDNNNIISFPAIYKSFNKDIYTYVSIIPNEEELYTEFCQTKLSIGDVYRYNNMKFSLLNTIYEDIKNAQNINSLKLCLKIINNNVEYYAYPLIIYKDNHLLTVPYLIPELDIKIYVNKEKSTDDYFHFSFMNKKNVKNNWIVLKAIIFPYISLFWIGNLIMLLGFLISIFNKIKNGIF